MATALPSTLNFDGLKIFIEYQHPHNQQKVIRQLNPKHNQKICNIFMDCSFGRVPSPFEQMLFPIRTNNFSNFCRDFFLPLSMNEILLGQTIAEKIFAGFMLIWIDIVTIPLRIVTTIPRAIYNSIYRKEKNFFYKHLLEVEKLVLTDASFVLSIEYVNYTIKRPFLFTSQPPSAIQGWRKEIYLSSPNLPTNISTLFQNNT